MLDAYLPKYYGDGASVSIDGVPIENIVACDLSGWIHTPPAGKVAIDPVLGRIAFADPQTEPPLVTFHYGFSDDMGGGEYDRADTFDELLTPVEKVPAPHATIQDALNAVTGGGVVEISNSGRYTETPAINVKAGQRVELRADNEHRPTIVLGGDLIINGATDSQVTLNGLLIAGGAIRVNGALRALRLRHCTLLPSLTPSLIVDLPDVAIEIDHCIIGALRVHERSNVSITDSIVDATNDAAVALAAANGTDASGTLQIADSTVIGTVHTLELKYASNSIFMSDVRSEKKQSGCVRFCYLPLTSIVPRRYRCQPEEEGEALRVKPQFTSLAYGDPGYGQLASAQRRRFAQALMTRRRWARSMNYTQPQRETNLRIRLDEYLRFGLEAGIFYVT